MFFLLLYSWKQLSRVILAQLVMLLGHPKLAAASPVHPRSSITLPVVFSVTRMSLGPRNAMLVGISKLSVTFSTVRVSSFTVGPYGDRGALA